MEEITEGDALEAGRQTGKSLLNSLFLRAMFANMMAAKKQGKHHVARVLRAQARIGKRIAKRKG